MVWCYLTDSEIVGLHLGRAEGARAKFEQVEPLAPLEHLEKELKLVFDGVGAGNRRRLHLRAIDVLAAADDEVLHAVLRQRVQVGTCS